MNSIKNKSKSEYDYTKIAIYILVTIILYFIFNFLVYVISPKNTVDGIKSYNFVGKIKVVKVALSTERTTVYGETSSGISVVFHLNNKHYQEINTKDSIKVDFSAENIIK